MSDIYMQDKPAGDDMGTMPASGDEDTEKEADGEDMDGTGDEA